MKCKAVEFVVCECGLALVDEHLRMMSRQLLVAIEDACKKEHEKNILEPKSFSRIIEMARQLESFQELFNDLPRFHQPEDYHGKN